MDDSFWRYLLMGGACGIFLTVPFCFLIWIAHKRTKKAISMLEGSMVSLQHKLFESDSEYVIRMDKYMMKAEEQHFEILQQLSQLDDEIYTLQGEVHSLRMYNKREDLDPNYYEIRLSQAAVQDDAQKFMEAIQDHRENAKKYANNVNEDKKKQKTKYDHSAHMKEVHKKRKAKLLDVKKT